MKFGKCNLGNGVLVKPKEQLDEVQNYEAENFSDEMQNYTNANLSSFGFCTETNAEIVRSYSWTIKRTLKQWRNMNTQNFIRKSNISNQIPNIYFVLESKRDKTF